MFDGLKFYEFVLTYCCTWNDRSLLVLASPIGQGYNRCNGAQGCNWSVVDGWKVVSIINWVGSSSYLDKGWLSFPFLDRNNCRGGLRGRSLLRWSLILLGNDGGNSFTDTWDYSTVIVATTRWGNIDLRNLKDRIG